MIKWVYKGQSGKYYNAKFSLQLLHLWDIASIGIHQANAQLRDSLLISLVTWLQMDHVILIELVCIWFVYSLASTHSITTREKITDDSTESLQQWYLLVSVRTVYFRQHTSGHLSYSSTLSLLITGTEILQLLWFKLAATQRSCQINSYIIGPCLWCIHDLIMLNVLTACKGSTNQGYFLDEGDPHHLDVTFF